MEERKGYAQENCSSSFILYYCEEIGVAGERSEGASPGLLR